MNIHINKYINTHITKMQIHRAGAMIANRYINICINRMQTWSVGTIRSEYSRAIEQKAQPRTETNAK